MYSIHVITALGNVSVTLEIILSKSDLAKSPVFVGILLVAISLNAQAQQLPNQIDLKASYCIALTKNQIYMLSNPDRQETDAEKRFNAELLDKLNSNLRRLQLYLVPRILSAAESESSNAFTIGIYAAAAGGKEDAMRAYQDANACLTTCSYKDVKCLKKCTEKSEAMTRTHMCRDLSFLPF